jgi:predicted nuclease with RNAse H fold
MITSGVDLASQNARTAACVVVWSQDVGRVTELAVDVSDVAIVKILAEVDKVGLDVPLGWPIAFARAVARHSEDGSWPPDYEHADTTAYRYRRTDLWVWKTLKTSPPLSVSTDRIALPAMRAAALLARLPDRVPRDGSGVVVEVYPAATLRRWGLPWRQYKGAEHSEARRSLVSRLLEETKDWLFMAESHLDRCRSSDDALDALIAALAARAAALGLIEPIPTGDQAAATREGWIAVPTEGSLALLPFRHA